MTDAPPLPDRAPDLARVRRLLARYDRPGPRYTSYPPAPVWSESFGEAELRAALACRRGGDVAVYVHIPFCERLCTYCACNREIHRDHGVADPYLDDLEREAGALAATLGSGAGCAQLAIGGGTPTFLDPRQLRRLCDIVDRHFPPAAGAERSIEVDPRVTTAAQLEVLAGCGFNRISLGVQDLSPVVQRAIRREQSSAETAEVTETARRLGFRSVNYDLIYGLPFQTIDTCEDTLAHVLDQRPDRIALYSYAHVTWVSKQQRGFERGDLPNAERKLAIFVHAMERLLGAGYVYLGLDHFALPTDELCVASATGDLRRNFMGYTTRSDLDVVALGASGISEVGDTYAQSLRASADWSARLRSGRLATLRGWALSPDDVRRRWLIQRLMCQGEVDAAAYAAHFGEPLERRIPDLDDRLAGFALDGLLARSEGDGPWRLTPEGRLLMRPVAMAFDAHLPLPTPANAEPPPQRYSRTV